MKEYLLTAGPTPVPERVLLAMARPVFYHRSPVFMEVLREVQDSLRWLFQTKQLPLILAGSGTVGMEARPIQLGQLAAHGAGDAIRVTADQAQDANIPAMELFIMGGRPIREPVAHYGPFVMNTREELMQAFDDFKQGRLGVIPAERLPHTG